MYKYILHKKSIKHICPSCNKKRLVRYIDIETNDYVNPKVGRCDREINCGYHYSPKLFFQDTKQDYVSRISDSVPFLNLKKETDFHTSEVLNKTLKNFDRNYFVQFLKSKFEIKKVNEMVSDYKIGTADNSYFGTVFWQIDSLEKIRGGKIINYNSLGKRTKYINWIHAIQIKQKEIISFNLNQCLFGLHLMSRSSKIIAIVESEKTACIMSMLFSKYEWMATGSLNGLNEKKIKVIKHRTIILYPDLGIDNGKGTPFLQWQQKRDALHKLGFDIEISDLLEQKSTYSDREKGLDIADYFIENSNRKPIKIKTKAHKIFLDMHLKNKNLKTLIDVFDLNNFNGNDISF